MPDCACTSAHPFHFNLNWLCIPTCSGPIPGQLSKQTFRLRKLYGVPLIGGEEASDDDFYEMNIMLSAHLPTPGVWHRMGGDWKVSVCEHNK